jgi:hypothetical protein
MLRTAQLLPRTRAFDTALRRRAFPPTPAVCYRAPWRLPGPDSHRLATTSFQPSQITAKVLPAAVREVFGAKALIQRCRLHYGSYAEVRIRCTRSEM